MRSFMAQCGAARRPCRMNPARRQFVCGALALGATTTTLPGYGWGRARRDAHVHAHAMTALQGDRFDLSIGEVAVNLTGRPAGPVLRPAAD